MPVPKPVAALLLLTLAAPMAGAEQHASEPRQEVVHTEVRIQRIIIRVPRTEITPASTARALPAINWVEKRTDRCVPVSSLAAVSITKPDSVDLMLAGGKRLRARLEDDCPTLNFYSGFYLKRTPDGMVCASRDSIRSRSGGQCRISSFRMLVPSR